MNVVTFIGTGERDNLCGSLYFDTCFIVVVWNRTCNVSELVPECGRNLKPEIIFERPVNCFSGMNNELSSFLLLDIVSVYHVSKLSGDGSMWIPLLSCFLMFNPTPVR